MSRSRHVILGVTASVALHRALDLASELRKAGHLVSAVMSPNATRLVSALQFQAITLSKVYHAQWETVDDLDHDHIRLADQADLMVVAPATAGTIGKIAQGLADNVLTTTAMAFSGPRLIAPAMNWRMWANEAVQENCATLRRRGWEFIGPDAGDLACGEQGAGRLAAVADILAALEPHLSAPKEPEA
jgi:phosphopantothenoylcysteine decarboxylase / phosphopantothenate---cysteine ligase